MPFVPLQALNFPLCANAVRHLDPFNAVVEPGGRRSDCLRGICGQVC